MNSTYDYLSSLLKEPKTQAYNQPASSTDTYSYLKSLLRPDADTVRVPSFSRSATGTDTYSYLKSLLRPDADVIYTPIQSTNNSNLDGVTLYTQDAVQNQQQSNVNNTQSAAEEQMIRDAVYMGGEPYTSKDQDDSNLRDAVYMGGEPYKSNGYDYNKWRDERINQLRWTANPEYSMDYQADLNELNRLISERDAEKAEYMAQPAAWTDSEKHARSLKQTDKWAYEDYITSDAYIGGNWNRWMTLAQPGKLLTTDEREEAKMAVQALGQVAEKLYWSHGDPTLLTLEEVRRYNTLTGLSGALASKESGMQAAILGGANIIPGEKISKVFHDNIPAFGAYQDSLYSDQNVADLMAKSNLSENAQAANPGIYTTANVAANIAAAAVGGELLAPLKAPQFVKDAIIFGAQGGINSAANQDWSKPWEAAGKTVLDTGISAATGVAAGMLMRKLYKAIVEDWYGVEKATSSQKWPETMDDLVNKGDEVYPKGAGESFNPKDIRFSQSSVNGADEITASMKANGWQGEPIDVVKMPDGKLTSVDNSRVASARQAGIDIRANVHGYDDPLTPDQMSRFATKKGIPTTWGEAIRLRIGKQISAFRNSFPSGSFDLPIFK